MIDLYPEITQKLEKMAKKAREDLGDDLTKSKGMHRRPAGHINK